VRNSRWMASLLVGAALCVSSATAGTARKPDPVWVTLGTMGGPIASPTRSQPANLLLAGEDMVLVDCGDGAAGQLARAGVRMEALDAIVISHLHADHTGGLGALIAMRYQSNVPGTLRIFGPPGTSALVSGIVVSLAPLEALSIGLGGPSPRKVADTLEVVELQEQSGLTIGAVRVSTRANNHFPPSRDPANAAPRVSLAYRFDAPSRSIVYTGDTGPSPAVEELARGADLLVSEMIDVDMVMRSIRPTGAPPMPPAEAAMVEGTLRRFHLAPEQVGELAQRAGVKKLVVTHLVAPGANARDTRRYAAAIRRQYRGPVTIANDLNRF
jgi:ribonuclease BN (tRNA processing enzyme)